MGVIGAEELRGSFINHYLQLEDKFAELLLPPSPVSGCYGLYKYSTEH